MAQRPIGIALALCACLFAGCDGDGSSQSLKSGPLIFDSAQVTLKYGYDSIDRARYAERVTDFNGDGFLDTYFIGSESVYGIPASLYVAYGSKTEIFGTPIAIEETEAAASADFNGDSHPDLVVATPYGRGASYPLLQFLYSDAGDGFVPGPTQTWDAPSYVEFIATGDVNGDGLTDIVVPADQEIAVLMNRGAGVPFEAFSLPGIRTFDTARLSDVNADGFYDLVGTERYPERQIVRLSRGDGTFSDPRRIGEGELDFLEEPTDLNGDGYEELVAVDWTDGSVRVYMGDATAEYTEIRLSPLDGFGNYGHPALAADFNEDGSVDLALIADFGSSDSARLLIAKGRGDGTFDPELVHVADRVRLISMAADLDRDGHLDISTVSLDAPSAMRDIYFGNGDGTFRTGLDPVIPLGQYSTLIPVLGDEVHAPDIDGDGNPDLVTASAVDEAVTIHYGRGDGEFNSIALPWAADANKFDKSVLADVDGDGDLDILGLSALQGYATILKNYGGRDLRELPANFLTDRWIEKFEVANDVNGDGRPDLTFVRPEMPGQINARAWSLDTALGQGTGAFGPDTSATEIYWNVPAWVRSGDVDGDGIVDLYGVLTPHGGILVWHGHGDGHFDRPTLDYFRFASGLAPGSIADVDGDGRLDLGTVLWDGGPTPATIAITRHTADASFEVGQEFALSNPETGGTCRFADLDRDRDLDLTCKVIEVDQYATAAGTNIETFLNDGHGVFTAIPGSESSPYVMSYGRVVELTDFNGDRIADWVHIQEQLGLEVQLGRRDGTFDPPHYFYEPKFDLTDTIRVVLGDFDRDGDLDIAWIRNEFRDELAIMKNHARGR